ncbi:MAG TPA: S8 family serine peptidase [Thermoanaerobaculia bacterium]|nr:S8 family serine peptidase [Thermoanaerobaculia bacterium]
MPYRSRLSLVLVASLSFASLAPAQEIQEPYEAEDPFDEINRARIENGRIVERTVESLPKGARSSVKSAQEIKMDAGEEVPPSKIHPLVQSWLMTSLDGQRSERLVVVFRDELKIPRFPEPVESEARESKTNQERLARAEELARGLAEQRAQFFREQEPKLKGLGIEVLETFWLVNAAVVRMPIASVPTLAERSDVLYIQPANAGEAPPQDRDHDNDVEDGRARIASDPYSIWDLGTGSIGLLDTGVRATHTLFNNPSHLGMLLDCVNGGALCAALDGNPDDNCWNHGTSSAAIITGNANWGEAFRGVTGITLNSYKVYPTSFDSAGNCNGWLDIPAAVRGFQRAVLHFDRIIVAEMQGSGGETSLLSVTADNVFDAGVVVIAANGNNGPNAGTVNAPANAHKVIAVGSFDVRTLDQQKEQSRGPSADLRYKPDIQAPTNTETASNANPTAFQIFSGTSGATPYAGGAAALLRNWLREAPRGIDPGQVYAHLILSGQHPYPFNNTSGAGPLRLPVGGLSWWGKVEISQDETIDIVLSVGEGDFQTLDGALWWPEDADQGHSDIDLSLIDPDGNVVAESDSGPSVFERARAAGVENPRDWTLRIRGFKVHGGPQTVYWAAYGAE